ncbi:trafficking kinesin-binding protein 1-like isoform X1 [Ictidomys tridecemlineatus]
MKDELLQFYTSAAEESEPESVCSTPLKRNESSSSVQNYFHLDSLQKKLKDLEEENVVLRSEACQLKTETITYEEKEQQLVNDCVKELRDANVQIASISEELAKKTEDAARQQEEITHLLSQIVDLQKKAKACAVENEELVQHLGAAKDAQRQLTAELRELEDKYAECMEMLHEAQEELKNLRNKTMPNTTSRRYHSLGLFPMLIGWQEEMSLDPVEFNVYRARCLNRKKLAPGGVVLKCPLGGAVVFCRSRTKVHFSG